MLIASLSSIDIANSFCNARLAELDDVVITCSARRALQKELAISIEDRDAINIKLQAVIDSITTTDMALLNKEISNEDERELGPLRYLAGITGWPMDKVVNWFLLLIIFVFDPLAIALVVSANFAFAHIKGVARDPKDYEVYQKKGYIQEPLDKLRQRVKENQKKLKKTKQKPKVIIKEVIKEVPVEVEKIVKKEVIKEVIKEAPSSQETSMYKPASTSEAPSNTKFR
jgi:hypothetical protein